ncbi:hypothetical protein F5J12DRAFT_310419 [Pisolithus orientalis]|uniref:uncharacterized protein n=1 Tax=Pisolithus orientalis TaxID=936130 RepID=UPI00222464F8|nr:uncharacterized protein F5J12DRAFT_310419 [Pisolithus orientalis]KAI6030806.1 hypothetical protein F5J12DRAFT_310419 [Pisolithus orientalis]
MSRKSSSSHFDFSIPGDELEHRRIQLEHNLQITDLSFHLSSVPDEPTGDNESVEYPRHYSAPSPFPGFASFEQHSRENLEYDGHSHLHPWSVHDDDDGGVNPYGAETMSTAAHHASAVTITAGLGRNQRREPSISGAEYDPDRPLQDIMAGMHTADAASLAARLRSPRRGHDLSVSEESDRSQEISRPKLAETLQRVGFSPRRPRSLQSSFQSPGGVQDTLRRYADASRRSMTPKARKIAAVSFDTTATPIRRHVSQPATVQPQVNVQPPTPSTTASNFTKMARGLTRDIRHAQDLSQADNVVDNEHASHPVSTSRQKDNPYASATDMTGELNHVSRASKKARGRVYLPDVTGLTNAVVSPAKVVMDRYAVRGLGSRDLEARLVTSLNALQVRLSHLENENSIARRRVRELEYELEQCKRDVMRERTRILESQDTIDVSARLPGPSTSRAKGKERKMKEADQSASKYFEVVEEKKALESLISTLRAHLARVTSDLSTQQQLLEDLRRLRESDALSLSEKTEEINQLRIEMERLAGELEVLRGVVEEGLNERRQARESAGEEEDDDDGVEATTESEQSDESATEPAIESPSPNRISRPSTPVPSLRRSVSETSQHLNRSRPTSPAFAERSRATSALRFVDPGQVNPRSADLEEHHPRSPDTSTSSGNASRDMLAAASHHPADRTSASASKRRDLRQPVGVEDELVSVVTSATEPPLQAAKGQPNHTSQPRQKEGKSKADDTIPIPPFPRISADLEHLFFSSPRRHIKACQTCKDPHSRCHTETDRRKQKTPGRFEHERPENDGGLDAGEPAGGQHPPTHDGNAPVEDAPNIDEILERMDRNGGVLRPSDVPPQTVLARVVRDLEDEFTHYKEIYRELAEQYRSMDCATQATKRHMVADHLRDVIDTIERKGDQITSLYGLLTFKDKPIVN